MFDAGLTPLQALGSISTIAAKLLKQSDRLGQIAPGYFGDFITVQDNPLTNLDTLRNITQVYQGGSLVR